MHMRQGYVRTIKERGGWEGKQLHSIVCPPLVVQCGTSLCRTCLLVYYTVSADFSQDSVFFNRIKMFGPTILDIDEAR